MIFHTSPSIIFPFFPHSAVISQQIKFFLHAGNFKPDAFIGINWILLGT